MAVRHANILHEKYGKIVYAINEIKMIHNKICSVNSPCELAKNIVELNDVIIKALDGQSTCGHVGFTVLEEVVGDKTEYYAKYITKLIDKTLNNLKGTEDLYDMIKILSKLSGALENIKARHKVGEILTFRMTNKSVDKGLETACKFIDLPIIISEIDNSIKIIIQINTFYDITVTMFKKQRKAKLEVMTEEGRYVRTIEISSNICSIDNIRENDKIIILLKKC